MSHPFELDGQEIENIGKRVHDLMNRVLTLEAIRSGVALTNVDLTWRENDPDAGIDADVRDAGAISRFIPAGHSIWQFKGGDVSPADIKKEVLSHPLVRKALQDGAHYRFVSGKNFGVGTKKANRRDALKAVAAEIPCSPDQLEFLDGADVAKWASDFPTLLSLPYFPARGISGLLRHEKWDRFEDGKPSFVATAKQEGNIQQLREDIRQEHHGPGTYRVEGFSGRGKTRHVLEALRPEDIAPLVLYAPSPISIDPALFHWMESRPDAACVLVVDECEDIDVAILEGRVRAVGNGVALITIGRWPSRRSSQSGLFTLEQATDEELRKIVETVSPSFSGETVSHIADLASGYISLAVLIARKWSNAQNAISVTTLSRDAAIEGFIEAIIGRKLLANEWAALRAASLLSIVGCDREVGGELDLVAGIFGMAGDDARQVLDTPDLAVLVHKKGRYRYVNPEIFAIRLAADAWGTHRDKLAALPGVLPTRDTRTRFFRRLASLGENEQTRDIVDQLLSSRDVFPDAGVINDATRAELLEALTIASPETGAATLDRLLGDLGLDDLRKLNGGRRAVVWTLQRLAWLPTTFDTSARLMLSLAEAENESYANNATGIWGQLFRLYLSGTSVPIEDRLDFIETILASPEASGRRKELAVDALLGVFATHASRAVVATSLAGRPLPPEWAPRTRGEERKARERALALLSSQIQSGQELVAYTVKRFSDELRSILALLPTMKVIKMIEVVLKLSTKSQVAEVVREIDTILSFDGNRMPPDLKKELERIREAILSSNFESRLARWVGKPSAADWRPGDDTLIEQKIGDVVNEAWADQRVLDESWDWLLSDDASRAPIFFEQLGARDTEWTLEQRLRADAKQRDRAILWGSYLKGRARAGDADQVDELLDNASKDESAMPMALDATWILDPSDRGAARITEMLNTGKLDPNRTARLMYGGWISRVSSESARQLIAAVLKKNGSRAALELLGMRLHGSSTEAENFAEEIWGCLEQTAGEDDTMAVFYWAHLAKMIEERRGAALAELIVDGIAKGNRYLGDRDDQMEVLLGIARREPEKVWPLLGEAMLREDVYSFSVQFGLSGALIDVFPPKTVIEWIEARGEEAARVVAELVELGEELSDVAQYLIERWGENRHVKPALLSGFLSGVWTGPYHRRIEQQLGLIEKWSHYKNKEIAKWAKGLKPSFQEEFRKWKQRDEEDFLR